MDTGRRSVSLQMAVTVAASAIMTVIAVLFIVHGYSGLTQSILSATEVSVGYATRAVNQSLEKTLLPAEFTLRMLRQTAIGEAKTVDERLEMLPAFAEALRAAPIADAVFMSYATDELFLLRRYAQNLGSLQLHAPAGSVFVLQTKTLNADNTFVREIRYYNDNLMLLGTHTTDNFNITPRMMAWYEAAMSHSGPTTTRAYAFVDTGEVGISMVEATPGGDGVLGVNLPTKNISQLLVRLRMTPNTQIVLVDDTGRVVAASDTEMLDTQLMGDDGAVPITALHQIFFEQLATQQETTGVERNRNGSLFGAVSPLRQIYGNELRMLMVIPENELLLMARESLPRYLMLAFGTLLLAVLTALIAGWWLARPLVHLAQQVVALSDYDFTAPVQVSTRFREVRRLGFVLRDMASAIRSMREISRILNREPNLEYMLEAVLEHLLLLAKRSAGAVYLRGSGNSLQKSAAMGKDFPEELPVGGSHWHKEAVLAAFTATLGSDYLFTPLLNREGTLIGVLCIDYPRALQQKEGTHFEQLTQYLEGIAGSAAVAVEMRQLILTQKALLEGIISLMAEAIDAKSLHTGGHCRRVPELACMILEGVKASQQVPFNTFSLSAEQEEEFRIAAWLHDLGKVTTPEYVVDKATKLETLYNRIHEIRMRYEVLHRDALIQCQQRMLQGAAPEEAMQQCQQTQARLQEEFAFVARCNIGAESMLEEDVARLQDIARQTWVRYFDSSLGLSRDEQKRHLAAHSPPPPVEEHLLADKPWHIVPWGEVVPPVCKDDPKNIWGFDMKLPQYMYNYGELYNLGIRFGTLTAEERFKINDHVVQTICMLSSLPWPPTLDNVPRIAGGHHEVLVGNGYPQQLGAEEMGLLERIMAIADIFEALTAPDRPYKEGKTLRQALSILADMVRKGNLDKDIYNLFVREKIYLAYATKFVKPEQIDNVAGEEFLVS